jgi:hypothetical protein
MVDFMCEQMLKIIQSVVVGASFFSLDVNEVSTIDNKSWILIHVYMM